MGRLAPTDRSGTGLTDREPQLVEAVLVQAGPTPNRDRDQPGRSDVPGRRRKPQLDPEHGRARLSPGYAGPLGGSLSELLPVAGCSGAEASASPSEA